MSRARGTFYIRKGVDRQAGVEKKLEDWSKLGADGLLTGCGIIEGSRRRARARRKWWWRWLRHLMKGLRKMRRFRESFYY